MDDALAVDGEDALAEDEEKKIVQQIMMKNQLAANEPIAAWLGPGAQGAAAAARSSLTAGGGGGR